MDGMNNVNNFFTVKKIYTNEFGDEITYNDSREIRDKVFDYLMEKFFLKYEAVSGEIIMQSDEPQLFAPEVLSEIADNIIGFELKG